jgi:hypothetical protein
MARIQGNPPSAGGGGGGEGSPVDLTFTYNGDGTVSGINGTGVDLDFTYANGLVDTIFDQVDLRTFNYTNGVLNTITIS